MAMQFSLSAGGNTVTLSALANISPKLTKETGTLIQKFLDGTTRVLATQNAKVNHEFYVNNVSATDAGYLNTWQEQKTPLTYTPDTASPGTTHTVIILNTEHPMSWMAEIGVTKWQGTIMIGEV